MLLARAGAVHRVRRIAGVEAVKDMLARKGGRGTNMTSGSCDTSPAKIKTSSPYSALSSLVIQS